MDGQEAFKAEIQGLRTAVERFGEQLGDIAKRVRLPTMEEIIASGVPMDRAYDFWSTVRHGKEAPSYWWDCLDRMAEEANAEVKASRPTA